MTDDLRERLEAMEKTVELLTTACAAQGQLLRYILNTLEGKDAENGHTSTPQAPYRRVR